MNIRLAVIWTGLCVIGCGGPETEIVTIPDPTIQVIGFDGTKHSIPSSDLYDAETGEPTVESVLVIDRFSNRQTYVKVDQLPTDSQADARYILVTEDAETLPSREATTAQP